MKMKDFTKNYISSLYRVLNDLDDTAFEGIKNILLEARERGNNIFVIGNGGSASTASHMTCDLSKGILGHTGAKNIKRFKIMSLDNLATLTAWSNDTGYNNALAEQLKNVISKDDVLIAISASGNSKNVINAVKIAKQAQAKIIGLAGFNGGELEKKSDICLTARIDKYDVAEDAHLIISHILTRWFFETLTD